MKSKRMAFAIVQLFTVLMAITLLMGSYGTITNKVKQEIKIALINSDLSEFIDISNIIGGSGKAKFEMPKGYSKELKELKKIFGF